MELQLAEALWLWLGLGLRLGPRLVDLRAGVWPMLSVVLLFFLLILLETDLGGSLLLLICAFTVMWVGGARLLPIHLTAARL